MPNKQSIVSCKKEVTYIMGNMSAVMPTFRKVNTMITWSGAQREILSLKTPKCTNTNQVLSSLEDLSSDNA